MVSNLAVSTKGTSTGNEEVSLDPIEGVLMDKIALIRIQGIMVLVFVNIEKVSFRKEASIEAFSVLIMVVNNLFEVVVNNVVKHLVKKVVVEVFQRNLVEHL